MSEEPPAAAALDAIDAWKHRSWSERDQLVRSAFAAGVNKRQIALRMGISRTTVYAILAADPAENDQS